MVKLKNAWDAYLGTINEYSPESKTVITLNTTINAVIDSIDGIPTADSLLTRIAWGGLNYFGIIPYGMKTRNKTKKIARVKDSLSTNIHDGVLGSIATGIFKPTALYCAALVNGRDPNWDNIFSATYKASLIALVAVPFGTFLAETYKYIKTGIEEVRTPDFIIKMPSQKREHYAKLGFEIAVTTTAIAYTLGTMFNGF